MGGTPNLPGIQSLAQKILMAKAEKTKAHAIAITKRELEEHSGTYLDSFHISIDGPLSVSVRNTAQYAYIIERGQQPHRIPFAGYANLAFEWKPKHQHPTQSGPIYHFSWVQHPGAIAYKILYRAMVQATYFSR